MLDRAVFKTAQVEFLDQFFSGSPDELRAVYEYCLALLDLYDDQPLSEVIAALEEPGAAPGGTAPGFSEEGAAAHFLEHWLADSSELAGRNVDRIFRHGYRTAIELALGYDDARPIESLWVSGTGDDFEIDIAEGPRQVNVIVFVPIVMAKRSRSRSWAVYPGSTSDEGAEVLEASDPPVMRRQVGGPSPTAG